MTKPSVPTLRQGSQLLNKLKNKLKPRNNHGKAKKHDNLCLKKLETLSPERLNH